MATKTDAELLAQVAAGILVNGNGEITPPIHKAIEDNIIDSKLSKKDGGNVIESLTGYTTDLTPSDDKHFVPKKYLVDALATKQDTLISGTNIKTVNGTSILGSGNISTALADGDYGDVVVSGTGTVITIDTGVVTNAKLAGSIAASKLVGTDINTVGTITAGTWNGTVIAGQYGGTGVANTGKTITVSGNLATTGAFDLTIAVPRTTTYTLPNTASETLAGLGTAQTFTLKQTFTAATTEITALTLLDTTYKTALSGASGILTLAGGFAQVTITPTAIVAGNLTLGTTGNVGFTFVSGATFQTAAGSTVQISKAATLTNANLNAVDMNFASIGYAPTASGTGSYKGLVFTHVINQTGTANQPVTIIDVTPTITAFLGTNLIGIRSQIASGTNRWNIYADGTANNHIAGNTGIGTTTTTASFLTIGAGTTAKSAMNLIAGVAPTSPNNGDIWFDGTDIKMRIGGATKVFTLV